MWKPLEPIQNLSPADQHGWRVRDDGLQPKYLPSSRKSMLKKKTTYHAQKGVPDLSVTTPIQAQF